MIKRALIILAAIGFMPFLAQRAIGYNPFVLSLWITVVAANSFFICRHFLYRYHRANWEAIFEAYQSCNEHAEGLTLEDRRIMSLESLRSEDDFVKSVTDFSSESVIRAERMVSIAMKIAGWECEEEEHE